ncbi:hypothetical protein CFVI97532_07110 [Campylobacter fetus subsp. venerealis cfvi97/532]|nr:hypothetical protein CFVI97532_07110 [Campylobacter fetus subsp. venerealis cfvi97/532]
MEKDVKSIEELNQKLIDYITKLQTENKELIEDTSLNAMHIKQLRDKFERVYNGLNDELRQTNKNCDEFSQGLEVKFNENSNNNYANFIKELVKNDFTAMQNNIVEDFKREFGGKAPAKQGSNLVSIIALILSGVSFVFLMLLNFKFDLFSQILK